MDIKEIKIIGLGGIGSVLVNNLSKFLNYTVGANDFNITLIDGDEFEDKNLERQEFIAMGNKAESKFKELARRYESLNFEFKSCYINDTNISDILSEGDTIFLCVDNHKTRKVVSDYVTTLNNVTLISGGNELTDGNVQLYVKKEGEDLTPSITDYHPEIENPQDKSPEDMSCEELSASEPQLYFTNLTVASIMCWTFHNCINKNYKTSEVYFDINQMAADPKNRKPKTKIKGD